MLFTYSFSSYALINLAISDSTYKKQAISLIEKSIYKVLDEKVSLNLESYPSQIWVPDNTVTIASLKLYSHNTKNVYDSICEKWVEYAKNHYLEERTGVL